MQIPYSKNKTTGRSGQSLQTDWQKHDYRNPFCITVHKGQAILLVDPVNAEVKLVKAYGLSLTGRKNRRKINIRLYK
jgi:hypothetical protein